ncbi:MAG TPA: hypothetical protein VKA37_04575 [Halobacteriales archaeon]|nr:hypothetical protein [Halobacteriales archaeon]
MTDGQTGGEQVFLVPIDGSHFERTVSSPVDLADHPDRPAELPDTGEARLWGVEDGTRSVETFERIEAGDLLLFYEGGTYVGVGRAGLTFEDEAGWASETFWDGADREYVFTVTDFSPLSIPRAAVHRLFDYGADYAPGFTRVAPDRVTASVQAIQLAVKRYDERQA